MRISFSKVQKKLLLNTIKTVAIALVIALIVSIVVTQAFQYYEGTKIEYLTTPTTTITISNETTFCPPFDTLVRKGTFDSIAKVYVYMSSPHADLWETFNIWMSLDNSSWVTVPFLKSTTDDLNQMAFLGLITFDNPQLTIYQKYFVPPQTVTHPSNVTKEDISSMKSNVLVKRVATPEDTTQWTLTFFTVFGFVFSIIGFVVGRYLSLKDSEFSRQDSGQKNGKRVGENKKDAQEKRLVIKFLSWFLDEATCLQVSVSSLGFAPDGDGFVSPCLYYLFYRWLLRISR